MQNDIPVYKITINDTDESGVEFISLVKDPAMGVYEGKALFVAMADAKKQYRFEANKDKQIVSGPFIIPDLPIYRSDNEMGEYYVVFEASEIEKIAKKFNRSGKATKINMDHSTVVDNAYVFENWLVEDSANDKSSKLGFDLPVGTWFGSVQIEDQTFWNEFVKSGDVLGFSIEGLLGLKLNKVKEQIKENKMKDNKIKLASEAKLKDGSSIWTSADAWAIGVDAYTVDKDGNQTPAADGEYELEDGTMCSVLDGKVSELESAKEEVKEDAADTDTKLSLDPADADAIKAIVVEAMASMKDEMSALIADLAARVDALEKAATEAPKDEAMEAVKAELAAMKVKLEFTPAKSSMTAKTDLKVGNVKLSTSEQLAKVIELNKKIK